MKFGPKIPKNKETMLKKWFFRFSNLQFRTFLKNADIVLYN